MPGLVRAANAAALELDTAKTKYETASEIFNVEYAQYDTKYQGLGEKALMGAGAGAYSGAGIGITIAKTNPELAEFAIPGATVLGAYKGAKNVLDIDTSGIDIAAKIMDDAQKRMDDALQKMERADGSLCVCIAIASKHRLDPAGINIAYPTTVAKLRSEYKI